MVQVLLTEFGGPHLLKTNVRLENADHFPSLSAHAPHSFVYYLSTICQWMAISPECIHPLLLKQVPISSEGELPPRTSSTEDGKYLLRLFDQDLSDRSRLLAVLVRETSRVKLAILRPSLAPSDFSPVMAEVCALLWGQGVLAAEAAFHADWELGHLSPEGWGYLLGLFSYLQHRPQPTWLQQLAPPLASLVKQSLDYLVQTDDCQVRLQPLQRPSSATTGAARDAEADELMLLVLGQSIQDAPQAVEALLKRAEFFLRQRKWKAAFADIQRALDRNPQFVSAYVLRSRLNLARGSTGAALRDLNQALELDQTLAQAYASRGRLHLLQHAYDEAMEDLMQALELESQDVQSLLNRGFVWERKGAWANAMADYEQAIALAPFHWQGLAERGWLQARLGDLGSALSDLNQAISLNDHASQAYFYRGLVHRKLGDLATAMEDFDRAIALEPERAEAHIERAFAEQRLRGVLEATWVELCYFDIPAEVYELRQALRQADIPHRTRVVEPSASAHTYKGSCLLVPEPHAEAAWDLFHRLDGNTDYVI